MGYYTRNEKTAFFITIGILIVIYLVIVLKI